MTQVEKIEVDIAGQGHITNTYLVYDETKKAIIIDPGDNPSKIISEIVKNDVSVEYIIITHAHGDHIGALETVSKYTNATILVHENDYEALIGKAENYCEMLGVENQNLDGQKIDMIKDGFELEVGNMEFSILHTPGHTSGGICIYEKKSQNLFTGDTLFCDCYGRCDLYSSDFNQMVNSIKMLFNAYQDIRIYPGHDKIVNIESAKKYVRMLMAMKGQKI